MKKEDKSRNNVDKKKIAILPMLFLIIIMGLCILAWRDPANIIFLIIINLIWVVAIVFFNVKYPKNKFVTFIIVVTVLAFVFLAIYAIIGFFDCINSCDDMVRRYPG